MNKWVIREDREFLFIETCIPALVGPVYTFKQSTNGHSDGVAASKLTPKGRRYRCSAAMQLLQPAEPFPLRRPVRRGLEGPAVGDWFRALPPLWSQWQWRSEQDKGDGEFSGAVGCKGTITSKILRRWIVIMRFLSPFDISSIVPLVIPALVPLSSFSQNDLVVHQDDHAELPTIEAMPYSFSVTSLLDLCLPLTLIGQLLSEKINASSSEDGLNFYDSGHRFEHS
ncbi:unnamed protein product [Sphenostylis stenocarpa]|uniref:Uncharacterized protein n=1 Tax=Sphenostylis stenocarpa TaxID=92480 RepID=A0AA86V8U8_9FABA|nr:unnamed protein product [Sphenostylis stenocarpa]